MTRHSPTQGSARHTFGSLGAVRALPGSQAPRARPNTAAPGLTRGLTPPHQAPDQVRGCTSALATP